MRRTLLCICFTFQSIFLIAQVADNDFISIKKQTTTVGEESINGYSVALDMSKKYVQAYIKDQMKTYGKVWNEQNVLLVRNATIAGEDGMAIYTTTSKVLKNQSSLWLGITNHTEFDDSLTKAFIYDWALALNIKNTGEQLINAQKAHEKNLAEAVSLSKKLANTQQAKIKNEKNVEKVAAEIIKLTKKLNKAKAQKENYLSKRDQLSEGDAREKMSKKYESAAATVISLQKKLAGSEKKQLNLNQEIREDEALIKKLESQLEANNLEKDKLAKELQELEEKKSALNKLAPQG